MKMISAKRVAARHMNVGVSKILVDSSKTKEIKEAITGDDIKSLISQGAFKKEVKGHSRGRARVLALKKKKGLKKGAGKRKGTKNARRDLKGLWLKKVRSQRAYIKILFDEKKIDRKVYHDLYRKVKGGFFRTKSHIDVYLKK